MEIQPKHLSMLPFRIVSNRISNNQSYRKLMQSPLVINWGWLISFITISVFNGWMIKVSQLQPFVIPSEVLLKQIITIYFAIFPLAATAHNFFKSTWLLLTIIIGSRGVLALTLCYFQIPSLNVLSIGFFSFNILLFILVLFFVSKTRGIVAPAFILFFIILLTALHVLTPLQSGEWAFHIVWYSNLIVAVNKAGRQLGRGLDNFDVAMLTLSGIAAVGLSIGWLMGSFSA